jgi:Fic family protein
MIDIKKDNTPKQECIAEFLAESNKIEGYDYPVEDYHLEQKSIEKIENELVISVDGCDYTYKGHNIFCSLDAFAFIKNHKKIDSSLIKELHISQMTWDYNLKEKDKGNFRTCPVFIGGKEAPKHTEISELIDEYCRLFNENKAHPLNLHYFFEYIHPFIDGNGRVGRLLYAMDILRRGDSLKPFLNNFIKEGACRGDIRKHPDNTFDQKRYRYYRALADFQEEYLYGTKYEGWWENMLGYEGSEN